jgi:hypothetical protein
VVVDKLQQLYPQIIEADLKEVYQYALKMARVHESPIPEAKIEHILYQIKQGVEKGVFNDLGCLHRLWPSLSSYAGAESATPANEEFFKVYLDQ